MARTKITSGGIADSAVTADELAGSIPNSKLTNSSITINGSAVALGGSVTVQSELAFPTIASITPSTITNDQTSITVTGTNFGASGIPTVDFISSGGAISAATTVTRDSATQLTVSATLSVDTTYFLRVELENGLAFRTASAILTVSDAPVWTTDAGSLGTIAGDFSGAVTTVVATGDAPITYAEVSGTGLTGASNANCSLNSATGAITTTDFAGSATSATTYNFTIRATDAQSQTADRAFSLTSSFGATGGMQFN